MRGNYALSLAEYRRIIEAKTAELFRVSCFLGATLSNRDDVTCELVGEFGRRLGVAYQIYDDLADVFGQEEDLGKTLGRDLAHGKVTLPTITLFSKLSQSEFTALLENLQNMTPEPDSGLIREIRNLLRQNGVLADSRACLAKELETTGTILDELEDDAMVSRLDDLRRVILARPESKSSSLSREESWRTSPHEPQEFLEDLDPRSRDVPPGIDGVRDREPAVGPTHQPPCHQRGQQNHGRSRH